MAEDRPRIGVTWVTPGENVSDNYLNAVLDAGGEPVVLGKDAGSWSEQLETVDGLLLTGGGDVAPAQYQEENKGRCESISTRRDILELQAFDFCRERGLPILGICRGFQVINVALGGKLIQDVESEHSRDILHASDGATSPRTSRYHPVRVLPGTLLSEIVRRDGEVEVNSRHHQGVTEANLAPGLRVNAVAADSIVEGFEAPGERFLLGLQCHPERRGESEVMVPVFAALVDRARATKQDRQRKMIPSQPAGS